MSDTSSTFASQLKNPRLVRPLAGAVVALGILGLQGSLKAAPYNFSEDFSGGNPPATLTPGTPGADYTDGWNDGDHGWIVGEGVGNVGNSFYFSQRSDGPYFTGGASNVGTLRTDGSAPTAAAIQDLPTDQNYTSGSISFNVQTMIGGWGSSTTFFLVGDVSYGAQIRFGSASATYDQLAMDDLYSLATIADTSTQTTDNKDLLWATSGFNPNAGNYGTVSIDFDLDGLLITLSTTDALGNTSSTLPVLIPTVNGNTKFTRFGFFLNQSPNSNGLVYMTDLQFTANPEVVPEPASFGLLAAGGLALIARRRRSC